MKIIKGRKHKTVYQGGYSLLEVMLVTVVISISFMAVFGLSASLLKGDTESRNEVIASNLAQEGLELARNIRDTNMLNDPADWQNGLAENEWYVPMVDNSGVVGLSDGNNNNTDRKYVYYNSGVGERYYNCTNSCNGSGVVKTPFRRWIKITKISNDEIEIACTVEWDSSTNESLKRSVSLQARLTDWDQN